MSGADLLEDGFPHSTADGYRGGCHGRSCPGVVDNGISCAEAFARYHGDYGFRKKVDAGMSPSEIVAAERAATTVPAPKPRPVAKLTAEPLSEAVLAADAAVSQLGDIETKAIQEDVTPSAPVKEIPLEKHGTPKGYHLGCRLKDKCPGIETVGKSCNQAVNEYQRALKENRRKRAAATQKAVAAPEPTTAEKVAEEQPVAEDLPDQLPDEPAEVVAEHELAGVDGEGELCSCGHHGTSLVEHLSEIVLGWQDEARRLREQMADLQQRMGERSEPPAVATLPDGTRVMVVVTVDRAA